MNNKTVAPAISLLLGKSAEFLKSKGSSTPRLDAELLLAEVLGMNRVDLYVNFDQPLTSTEVDRYRELIRRRGKGEPVAYILGRAYFLNLTIKVDRTVLVPRPETEHVVEAVLGLLAKRDWSGGAPRILDVGTGSGAIAIAIAAAYPDAEVTAVDSSEPALELARENARTAGLAARITFALSDLLADLDPLETFDLIVSNPPYIADDEWDGLPVDVREFEPRAALYGGPDGLDYYRRLVLDSPQLLRPEGAMILEIGYRQGRAVKELIEMDGRFTGAVIEKDHAGHDRVVVASRSD
jgi:release factor glutamine methyltransferase